MAVDPLDLRRVAQFVAVAQGDGLTSAAHRLHVTQQALSASMRQLESNVGVALFDRDGRRLVLSDAGRALCEGAPVVLAAAAALRDAARAAATAESPAFVVGHSPAITGEEAFELIEPLRRAMPHLSVTVRQLFPRDLQRGLLDRSVDVGLRRGATTPADLAAAVIRYDRLSVAVRWGHPLSERREVQLSDIGLFTLVVWAPPTFSFYTDFLVSVCRRAGVEPNLVVDNLQGNPPITAVVDNDYVALVTAPPGAALAGRVRVVPLTDPPMVPVQAMWLPHTVSAARTALLTDPTDAVAPADSDT